MWNEFKDCRRNQFWLVTILLDFIRYMDCPNLLATWKIHHSVKRSLYIYKHSVALLVLSVLQARECGIGGHQTWKQWTKHYRNSHYLRPLLHKLIELYTICNCNSGVRAALLMTAKCLNLPGWPPLCYKHKSKVPGSSSNLTKETSPAALRRNIFKRGLNVSRKKSRICRSKERTFHS